MSDPASRYQALPTYLRTTPRGEVLRLRQPRLPTNPPVAGRHRVGPGERLDHLAWRHLSDPYAWWRFADALPGVDVDRLDDPGRWLPVPRQGTAPT